MSDPVIIKCGECQMEMEVWPGPSRTVPSLIHDPLDKRAHSHHIIAWDTQEAK